jgi:alpha-beta hydrolase superfamily lysophospholipase
MMETNTKETHTQAFFHAADGSNIFYQSWLPVTQAHAVLAICPGLGDHSGRYSYLATYFVGKGYAVYALDTRGHGRSDGKRGYVSKWDDYRQDLREFIQNIKRQHPSLQIFLMGHSLGGLMVLDCVLHYPENLQGVITSAPALISTAISPGKLMLARFLSGILPGLQIKAGLDAEGISSQPEEVQRYKQDPLVHDWGTPRLSTEAAAAQQRCLQMAPGLKPPILMVHGDADRLMPVESSRKFFDLISHSDKQLTIYPGVYHESHNDFRREQYFADLETWIQNHC